MRQKSQWLIFIISSFLLSTIFSILYDTSINDNLPNNDTLSLSAFWNLSQIVIDDSGGGDYNWSEAVQEEWCSGSGNSTHPYIIENVTFAGDYSGNMLSIMNSNVFFIIKNCTFYKSNYYGDYNNAGIYLYTVSNGNISNCFFQHLLIGIRTHDFCYNNTILNNDFQFRNQPFGYGIRLQDNCCNNTIFGNNISVITSGLILEGGSNYNNITYNNFSIGEFGIQLWSSNCEYNNISFNIFTCDSISSWCISTTGSTVNYISNNTFNYPPPSNGNGNGTPPVDITLIIAIISITSGLIAGVVLYAFYFFSKKKKVERRTINKGDEIKKILLELGTKFSRLSISDIAEECNEKESIIKKIVNEMINNKEIYAKYFRNSNSLVFIQQAGKKGAEKIKEIVIVEEKKKCIVCRGDITHLTYECPQCKLKYHFKCANSLRDDEKGCFQCYEPIPILPDIPEIIEVSDKEKGEPIVVSLQNMSNELAGMLLPEEIKHKDITSDIIQIKRNLRDEMQHKISGQFFNEFRDQIDELFENILSLNVDDLKMLGQLKIDQRTLFYSMIEGLKEVKGHCKNCGNRILDVKQEICEFCGLDLK